MTEQDSTQVPHNVKIAWMATRLEIQMKLGGVDKETLRDDLMDQFGTRDIDEATRRLAMLNRWLGGNDD